jgi:hypothetical protein
MNLTNFNSDNFINAVKSLFVQLNVPLNYVSDEPTSPEEILSNTYKDNDSFRLIDDVYFVGMVSDETFKGDSLFSPEDIKSNYDGILIFGVTLKDRQNGQLPTRSQLAEITRAFNREYHYTPVVVIFKYNGFISFANTERLKYKQEWREGEKLGKVSMLKDINIANPHRGHIDILNKLIKDTKVNSFEALYKQWRDVFDVQLLNKQFYQEISNWYEWAINKVKFPNDINDDKDDEKYNSENIIRLLTRIIFIWFLKEKNLIPELIFNENELVNIVKDFKKKDTTNYYKAILQNLFFATLNQKIEERKFVIDIDFQHNKKEYGIKTLFRYSELFLKNQNEILNIFMKVPFVNGGLFDCLDSDEAEVVENSKPKHKVFYYDGFSRNNKKQAEVPNILFFNSVNISNTKSKSNDTAFVEKGLINILNGYKFTVAENTPIEEEIALDPELLGRIFENLLASYNPETGTTARKATGSFYTPREIVNYMVDESLITSISNKLNDKYKKNFENELRTLFSYQNESIGFDLDTQSDIVRFIIQTIDDLKILDPACGSGAFPMGILQKLVFVLHRLDPENKIWLEIQKENIIKPKMDEIKQDNVLIMNLKDEQIRKKAETALEERLNEINDAFNRDFNYDDYARKLFLIENSIYGVDIQTIAIQISKLRCFISLIIDQKGKAEKSENYGIKPLPNLETKFVAANTLIGLEKPTQYIMRNPKIDEIENELKKQRHEYFLVNTRAEKLALQNKDKKLRQKLAELLKDDGWNDKVAEKISSYSPYDQNKSTEWFEPEWMFGIKDGFDIVIGNPPYGASYPDEQKKHFLNNYFTAKSIKKEQKGSLDTFTLFVELGNNLIKKGNLHFIVPMSITSSDSMMGVHKMIESNCSIIRISSFSNRPKPVFESAFVKTSILFLLKDNNSCSQLLTSKMYRQNNYVNLEYFLKNLEFINVLELKLKGRYPKLSKNIETLIFKKVTKTKKVINNLIDNNGLPIYYRAAGGRYFNVVTNYPTDSSAEKAIFIKNEYVNLVGLILSSSLFWWYQQAITDCLNLKTYEIGVFGFPDSIIEKNTLNEFNQLYEVYLKDIEKNAKVREAKTRTKIDSFKEYKLVKSKYLIDKIDDIICKLYGLSDEETDFIKKYEIHYRLGDEE